MSCGWDQDKNSEPIDWEEQAQLKTQFEEQFSMKNGHIFKDRSANKTPKEIPAKLRVNARKVIEPEVIGE